MIIVLLKGYYCDKLCYNLYVESCKKMTILSGEVVTLKKFISVMIALFLLLSGMIPLSSAHQTTTYHMNAENLELYSSAAGTYLINYYGVDCHIEKLCPDTLGSDLRFNHTIADVGVFNDTVVVLCNDTDNHQLEVYTYRTDTDVLDSFAVDGILYYGARGFFYDGSGIFLTSEKHSNVIDCYGASGKLTDSAAFNSSITQIGVDYGGNLFAVSGGMIYRWNNHHFTLLADSAVSVPITFASERYFTDAVGKCYEISNSRCIKRMQFEADYGKYSACLINNTYYYPSGKKIIGYSLSSGEKISIITLDYAVLSLYAYKGNVWAVCKNGSPIICRISPDEFTGLKQKNIQQGNHSAVSQETFSDDRSNDTSQISSDVYHIDYETYSISQISVGTTPAQFKQNIRYDGYSVVFYRDGKVIKSGNCGTAMTVVFENGSTTYTFVLSVVGDITGEGNVNDRDVTLFMDYLIGTAHFDGIYLISADVSGDGETDVRDLAAMYRRKG